MPQLYPVQKRPVEIPKEFVFELSSSIFEGPHFVPMRDHGFPYGGKFAPKRNCVFACRGGQLVCLMERDTRADLNSECKKRHHET